MMSDDRSSSSESDAGADLLDSILGVSGDSEYKVSVSTKARKSTHHQSSHRKSNANKELPTDQRFNEDGEAACTTPPQGLKLELKGLPLRVGPRSCSKGCEDRLTLQPHQKVLRLSIDGDPTANPAGKYYAASANLVLDFEARAGNVPRCLAYEYVRYSTNVAACRASFGIFRVSGRYQAASRCVGGKACPS